MKKRSVVLLAAVSVSALALLGIGPSIMPTVLSLYRSDILFSIPTTQRVVFVTIDDAPSTSTNEILAVLKKHEVPATFFIISDRVTAERQLEEIVAAKHSLGNHMRSTTACSKLSFSEFRSSFDSCAAVLERYGKPKFFRPASDFGSRDQIAYAGSKGYQAIVGTIFPLDHWISNPNWLVRLSRWLVRSGGILILHDGAVRGHTTAAVLDRLIPELKAAGYSFRRLENEPNKAPEPTSTSVMPRATLSCSEMKLWTELPNQARVMPAVAVAHL